MHNVNELRKIYASGTLETADGNKILLEELNYKKCIIGSDEAGKGEIFRPLVTAAAYIRPENIDKLIKAEVQDSKGYGETYAQAKEKIYSIGEQLTGFTSYKDFEGKAGKAIRTDYATFAVSILLNHEFNQRFEPGSGRKKSGNLFDLQRHEYKVVLQALAGAFPYDYVVVDDFQNGKDHDKILKEIDIPAGQAVIATKADSQVAAVACASVIAYYLTNPYVVALDKTLEEEYGINVPLDRSGNYNSENFQEPLKRLKKASKKGYEGFLEKYAKSYYMRKMDLGD